MPRPIVEIYQQVANVTLTPANPTLPTCIVGPAYHLVQYPASNSSSVVYGNQGGWDDPFEVTTDDELPARDPEAVAYSAFGLTVPGTHTVDQDSVKVYLEDVYYAVNVGGNYGVAGCSVADSRVITSPSIAVTTPSGGVKAGDRVILAPEMPQVLYDDRAECNFLTSVAVGDVVHFNVDALLEDIVGTKELEVAQVIDNNRLLLKDAGGYLNGLAGTEVLVKENYVVKRGIAEVVVASGIDAGAIVKHTPVERVVQSVTGTTTFVLASDVKFKSGADEVNSGISARFERKLPASTGATAPGYLLDDATMFSVGPSSVTLGKGALANYFTLTVGSDDVKVIRAKVCLDARGLIVNLPEFLTFSAIPADLDFPSIGKVHPDNPLAMAMYVALSNSGNTSILALCVPSDNAAGYNSVRSKLNSHDTVYAIVPLSTDIANVIAAYKNDAEAMSAPAKGKFRHVVAASAGLPSFKFVGPSEGGETGTGETANGSAVFHDENATFKTDGVVAGDKIVITSNDGGENLLATPVELVVLSVTNEQNIVLTANAALSSLERVYTIQRSISTNKDLQVDALKSRIASVASKRLTVVYPGSCKILGFSGQSGAYLAAAVGAMIASLSPHRPKNNIGIAGVEQIYDSNLHFGYDQIDAISDGGYLVFIQDSVEALPYCVHQLTTGQVTFPGVQEYCELSVVNNFDYVSKVFKNRLTPFVGSWNMIPEAFGAIRSTLESAVLDLKSRTETQIGPPLTSGKVESIEKSLSDSGTLVIKMGISIPKVLNRLQVFLESQ